MVGPCVPVCPHLTTPHHHFLVLEWQVNGKMPVGGHKYQNIILGLINTHNMITPTVSSLNNKKKEASDIIILHLLSRYDYFEGLL